MIRQQDRKKKPEWDTSVPGLHPALRKLKPSEEELQTAANSIAANLLSRDERWVAQLQQHVGFYSGNLRTFLSPVYKGKDKPQKVYYYRAKLAGVLADLGRFDEALEIITDSKGHALPKFGEIAQKIREIQAAVERNDDEECDCERVHDTIPLDNLATKAGRKVVSKSMPTEAEIALNRRASIGEVYSEKHNRVVQVWQCAHCGDTNATATIPERQVALFQARTQIDNTIRPILAAGKEITADEWAAKYENPMHADAKILAVE